MSCHHDHTSSHEYYEIKKDDLGNKGSRKLIEPTLIKVTEKTKQELELIYQDILKELKIRNKDELSHVAILNKDRSSYFFPCPPKGSISKELEDMAKSLLSPSEPCKVIIIGNTEPFSNLKTHPSNAIPFFSLLIGLSYIGHTVIVFEGNKDTMEVFCKDADICIVDDAIAKLMESDWKDTIKSLVKNEEVYIYDRKTCNLNEI